MAKPQYFPADNLILKLPKLIMALAVIGGAGILWNMGGASMPPFFIGALLLFVFIVVRTLRSGGITVAAEGVTGQAFFEDGRKAGERTITRDNMVIKHGTRRNQPAVIVQHKQGGSEIVAYGRRFSSGTFERLKAALPEELGSVDERIRRLKTEQPPA